MTLHDETAPPTADARVDAPASAAPGPAAPGAETPGARTPGTVTDARAERGTVVGNTASRIFSDRDDVHDPWSIDLERIQFSPYFSRLSAVTQVVSPSISGAPVHNRLTHTLKVSAIARVVALQLNTRSRRAGEGDVCNATVVEAAAYAHDLGHPPFGHLGESTLNRLARDELGCPTASRATRRPTASSPRST